MTGNAIENALTKLNSLIVTHHNFKEAQQDLLARVDFAQRGEVILFVGPSAAGMNTVIKTLHRHLAERDGNFDPFRSIMVDAVSGRAPESETWKRALTAADEPPIGQRASALDSGSGLTLFDKSAVKPGQFAHYNRLARALHSRDTATFILKSADQLTQNLEERDLEHVIHQLHQLVNSDSRSPACAILVGGYDLLRANHIQASTSLFLTTRELYPYQTNQQDIKRFAEALNEFQLALGNAATEVKLVDYLGEIIESTKGNIGWVKKSLREALHAAMRHGKDKLTWGTIKRHLPSKNIQKQLQAEIDLRNSLVDGPPIGDMPPPQKTRKPSKKPGTRNPNRDPVRVK